MRAPDLERLEVYRVAMPLSRPFRVSFFEYTTIESVVVRLVAADAEVWVEAAAHRDPFYSADWAEATFVLLCRLGPQILQAGDREEIERRLAVVRGNAFTRGALDALLVSLDAVRAGLPLHRYLGAQRDFAEVGADIGILASLPELLEQVDAAVAAGYRRVKLKTAPGWDIEVVEAVRTRFPDLVLHIDCNGAYTLDDVELFLALDRFGLAMIEQPLNYDDLYDHAVLQTQLETAICLDESIVSPRHASHALELGSCRVINLKPCRVGGLTAARQVIANCASAGVPVWIGSMLESGLGASVCAALACLNGVTYPSDIFPSERFYECDLAVPSLEFFRGADGGRFVRVKTSNAEPRPDPEVLARWTMDACVLPLGALE